MSNSRSTWGEAARAEPRPVSFAALLIQDATHIDPLMDAWGQDVIRCLIEGIQAGLRGFSAALLKLIDVGRSLEPRRPPSPTNSNRWASATSSSFDRMFLIALLFILYTSFSDLAVSRFTARLLEWAPPSQRS
jgi:hypothetical protein